MLNTYIAGKYIYCMIYEIRVNGLAQEDANMINLKIKHNLIHNTEMCEAIVIFTT